MDKNQEVDLFLAEVDDECLYLPNIAFRVPGTTGDAGHTVQEACAFRYRPDGTRRAAIDVPQAWLTVVAYGYTRQMCRKLASFARRRVCDRRRRESESDVHTRIVTAFWAACDLGDLPTLVSLLDPDATTLTDGGGKVRAALHPVHGADRTARFMLAALSQHPRLKATPQSVNGNTALVLRHDTTVSGVVSFHVQEEKITDVWLVLNPDKLRSWNRS